MNNFRRRGSLQDVDIDLGYAGEYLTFTAVENTTFSFTKANNNEKIYYSINDGTTWEELAANSSTPTIAVGDSIKWKGALTPLANSSQILGIGTFNSTGKFNCYGNPISLLFSDNFRSKVNSDLQDAAFAKLFLGNKVVSCENFVIPIANIGTAAFFKTFESCPYLVTAPQIDNNGIIGACAMKRMFYGCSLLTNVPDIRFRNTFAYRFGSVGSGLVYNDWAFEVKNQPGSFNSMFEGCTSLVTLPRLIPSNLSNNIGNYCCYRMFYGGTNISQIPADYFSALKPHDYMKSEYCFSNMFGGCTQLQTLPTTLFSLQSTNLPEYCFSGMFYRCTALTTIPNGFLPYTNLHTGCYASMFSGCTSLATVPRGLLPATTLAFKCYAGMFQGCESLSDNVDLPSTTLANQCYSSMYAQTHVLPDVSNIDFTDPAYSNDSKLHGLFAGTEVTDEFLNSVLPKENGRIYLPAQDGGVRGKYAYERMFRDCINITIAPKVGSAYGGACFAEMFSGCRSLVDGGTISIPNTTPDYASGYGTDRCHGMFMGCANLETVTISQASLNKKDCQEMFNACSKLQTVGNLTVSKIDEECCSGMFRGCSRLTVAPTLSVGTLVKQCYNEMFRGCSSLQYITCNATNISAEDCTKNWTSDISATGTFKKAQSMNGWTIGPNGIPSGWTIA